MIIVSTIISIYLLIGILCMMLSVSIARKHGTDIGSEIVIKGVLLWFFSLPEFLSLIWTTIKLIYWKEKIRRAEKELIRSGKRYRKLLEKLG